MILMIRVSSVLNKDNKQFGSKNMFDGSDDTCWNSHQGSPQFVCLEFDKSVDVKRVKMMFQGGFVGKNCEFMGLNSKSNDNSGPAIWTSLASFTPEDSSLLQTFELAEVPSITALKIHFPASTDLFGRITIYRLEVWGRLAT